MVYLYVATATGPRALMLKGGEGDTPDAFAAESTGSPCDGWAVTPMPGHDLMDVARIARTIRGPGAV